MTEKETEILRIVQSNIEQSREGLDKENNKFDFKAKWYNLKDKEEINEFLKDTTAIVNTIGLTGYIVIGYNDKKNEVINAKFADCGLRDTSDLLGLINKRVDRAFDIDVHNIEFENTFISVIELHPSLDKPHVIRDYLKNGKSSVQKIFVRNATGTIPAGKHHIDLMYYDRKNIIPEHKMFITTHINGFQYHQNQHSENLSGNFYIENTGSRALVITEINIEVTLTKYKARMLTHLFSCSGKLNKSGSMYVNLRNKHLIIKSNTIEEFNLGFKFLSSNIPDLYESNSRVSFEKIIGKFVLNTGKIITTEIEITSDILTS